MSSSSGASVVSSLNPLFKGRDAELSQFHKLLHDPKGKAVVIVGQQGFGKSTLARECLEIAERHPNTCHSLWYEVITEDTADAIMERMLEEVFAAAGFEDSLADSETRKAQLTALLKFGAPKRGQALADFLGTLKAQQHKPARERLRIVLQKISSKLPDNERLIFVMDPEKYLKDGSAEAWTAFLRHVPPKVLFLIPQRPDDKLAQHDEFLRLAVRLPKKPLAKLAEKAVDALVEAKLHEVRERDLPRDEIRQAVRRYKGHPYAVAAALELVTDVQEEERLAPADLPADPAGIAAEQWKRIQRESTELAKVFEAHAVLEVPVPMEVVCEVAGVEPPTYRAMLVHPYLGGLLSRHEDGHRRIYHSLLSEFVLRQLVKTEATAYHERARDVYCQRLETSTPKDKLAALRLPEHVLAAEGEAAFAEVVGSEVGQVLFDLGFLEEALALLQRARLWAESGSHAKLAVIRLLGGVAWHRGELNEAEARLREALELADEEDLEWQATVSGNLGLIYWARSDLDGAEQLYRKALEIYEKLGNRAGIATQSGNLGLIYQDRGDLDGAEQLYRKALEIDEKLGNRAGIATHSGNLGLIYQDRGDLDGAEQLHRKALEIDEKLGNRAGIARHSGNLGLLYRARGDVEAAREWWQKAVPLYEKLGSPWAETVKRWLAELGE